jgi:c(7)-type cytochrome triheme protein
MKTVLSRLQLGLLIIATGLQFPPQDAEAALARAKRDNSAPAQPAALAPAETSATVDASENGSEARAAIDALSLYDPENPDLATMQRADLATKDLPKDSLGFTDWMKALRSGTINPRASLDGKGAMNVLDKDVILRNTKEMPWVRFPHLSHTMWLDCSNCHPSPFVAQAGANRIAMADIFRGKFCGMCHDRIAFVTFFSCMRCHSVPQTAAPAQN